MKGSTFARRLSYLCPLFVLCLLFYYSGITVRQKGYAELSKMFLPVAGEGTLQDALKASIENLNSEKVAQDDDRLVNLIRQFYLEPASVSPYNLTNDKRQDYSQGGQSAYVDALLDHAENGFFVESGALDGELNSNSLLFEKYRQWTGLLVEPNPYSYRKLQTKNRKSSTINACLSPYQYPVKLPMKFASIPGHSKLNLDTNTPAPNTIRHGEEVQLVQCFPLYSILLSSGRTNIGYFSLDIEGAEMNVLRTIPWDKVDIKVIQIEKNQIKEGIDTLIDFMTSKGYTHLPLVQKPGREQDIIFVKDGFEYNKSAV